MRALFMRCWDGNRAAMVGYVLHFGNNIALFRLVDDA